MGRRSKYKTHVEPRLEEVSKMALTMTEEQIAACLGVGHTAFSEYKRKYPELTEALKKGRSELVKELKSTLIQKAKGFKYEEKKVVKEHGKVVREEITQKSALPDLGSIHLLLKNYDKEWSNDPAQLELKKQELELKKKQIEDNSW